MEKKTTTMSIEERAKAKYHYTMEINAYIAGASEQQALIDQQKIAANTPPADILKGYDTYEENAAHQSGFIIGCEWKEARIKELESSVWLLEASNSLFEQAADGYKQRVKELEEALKNVGEYYMLSDHLKEYIENALNHKQQQNGIE